MPRSNNQTSPRAGVILFGVKQSKELVGSVSRLLIIQRAGIERKSPAQDFRGENPFLLFGERLERVEKLGRLLAHFLLQFTGDFVFSSLERTRIADVFRVKVELGKVKASFFQSDTGLAALSGVQMESTWSPSPLFSWA
jgi:hypothetical protein